MVLGKKEGLKNDQFLCIKSANKAFSYCSETQGFRIDS